MRRTAILLALFLPASAQAGGFPEFPDPNLKLGREIWLGTCYDCHANPLSEAPQAKRPEAWAGGVAKGREALYRSALNGFAGASEMPPRGGNPSLTDAEVRAAVDYMLKLVAAQKGETP
jgi:cytochrome c5